MSKKTANTMIFVRKLFGDRAFDKALLATFTREVYDRDIEFIPTAKHLLKVGYSVFMYDFRNHGESGSSPNGGMSTLSTAGGRGPRSCGGFAPVGGR
jgi:hypothetical protein